MVNFTIIELLDLPELIPTIVQWIRTEWPDSRNEEAVENRLCGSRLRSQLPSALVMLDGAAPIGFVSLTLYEKGIEQGRPHWIDALYIEPAYRRRGLALKLIQAAEIRGGILGISEIFALTEIPGLYHKAGWHDVQKSNTPTSRDVIVGKRLAEKR